MSLDIAMGGSTNTVLHLLAAAHEAEVDFTMADIDRLSRRVPNLCKVAPSKADVHMEDVHRAGGIMAILGELDRAGLLHAALPTVHAPTLAQGPRALGHRARGRRPRARPAASTARPPAACAPRRAFSQDERYDSLDTDRAGGRDPRRRPRLLRRWRPLRALRQHRRRRRHREDRRGGRVAAALLGAPRASSRARRDAVAGILGGRVARGDVVLIRYEGPKGGPGMQEMLYPTSYLKSRGLGPPLRAGDRRPVLRRQRRALDRPRPRPRPAEGGAIGLVEEGDTIVIDIPDRVLRVALDDATLAARREAMVGTRCRRVPPGGPAPGA